MRSLLLILVILLFAAGACTKESKSLDESGPGWQATPAITDAQPMPDSVKDEIRADVAAGLSVTHSIASGGTGAFASSNGGKIIILDRNNQKVKEYKVEGVWATDALRFLTTVER